LFDLDFEDRDIQRYPEKSRKIQKVNPENSRTNLKIKKSKEIQRYPEISRFIQREENDGHPACPCKKPTKSKHI
jgi:hypothetical protein